MSLAFRCPSCGGVNRVQTNMLDQGPKCGRCQAAYDPAAKVPDLTDEALAKLVKSSPVPVLVDFWAPWCGPCRAVAPHIQALAERTAGRLIIAKVNTDIHSRTAAALGVRGIPTLALWKDGQLVKSEAGARMGPQLDAFVAPHL